ncbi:MAG: efflux system, outer rane lipoprotein NodT family [Sphingomonas bacterium]|uniref:efflux transporter outer membrane subunit n=1 Tax=Sphingomonas bacterium TaxID=1895847 RepID=UPI002637BE23|nr:efflux transporter outer membrane subunit [Sphingomonas bacterium]MDB5707243.1 efflux system, outer rane lipoprotein NodT family [Sphingomonas bacterium]
MIHDIPFRSPPAAPACTGRARGHRLLASLAAAALLSGCMAGPDFRAPAPPSEQAYLPNQATDFGPAGPNEVQQRLDFGAAVQPDWWTRLGSPELDKVVELALANNRSLAIARANLSRAAHDVAAARGSLLPQVDGTAEIARQKYGALFLGPQAFTFPTFSAYSAGVGVSYDLDLFGGNRRRVELAAADAETQKEGLNAARLTVAGDTVIEALQIAATRAQIEAVQNIIASDQKTLDLVRAANATGVASQIDVTTAQSQLDRDRALLPPLRQQLNVAQDALAVLVGKAPASWSAPDFSLAAMTLPQDVPLIVPSDLVRARPDIRAAEAQLHAANAAIGIATADLYPHINLNAGIAEQGLTGGPAGSAWSLLGGLVAPIFHGGTLTARKRAAGDTYDAAFGQYQQTVLVAFQQVADSLHGLANSADAVKAQQQALASADAALRLTRLGYGVGNAGIVQVLDAQRLQQLAELNLVQARTQRYVLTVTLFLAAGGGIANPPAPVRVAQR